MLKYRAKAQLYHQLATLSKAGFPANKAAQSALDERRSGPERQFLEDLKRGVEDGNTLSGAAGNSSVGLTPLEIQVLRACEEGGNVPGGFAHLSRYFDMLDKAKRKILWGMLRPTILIHCAIVLPLLVTSVYSRDFSGFALKASVILLALYALVGFGYLLFKSLSKRARTEPGADRLLRKIPFIGKARHAFALSRFAEVLRIQLVTGRGPMRGIRDAAATSGSGSLIASAKTNVLEEVENGRRAGPGFIADRGKNFPETFARSYSTAEEAGSVDEEMALWSNAFAGQAEEAIDRLSKGIPKVIYIVVGAYAIYAIISMYSQYLDQVMKIGEGIF